MRLWSVHPRYLDRQGLVAGWREALLAQKVLTGTTTGYRHHPQLVRFRGVGGPELPPDGVAVPDGAVVPGLPAGGVRPGAAITTYLHALADEATARAYVFDRSRVLGPADGDLRLEVTDGQLAHEWAHLRAKLAVRSPEVLARWDAVVVPDPHPLFVVVPGPVAPWEVRTDRAGDAGRRRT